MKNLYHKFLQKLAHFQVEHPYIALLLILALTVSIFGGVSQVKTVASLEQMMPKDIEEIKAFHDLRDNYMGQDMVAVIVQLDKQSTDPESIMDIRDYEIYEYMTQVERIVGSEPDIIETYSFVDIIDNMKSSNEETISKENYRNLIGDKRITKHLSNFINNDKTITFMLATTDVSADDPRMNLLSSKLKKNIDSLGHPTGIEVKLTGTPIIQQKLGEMISKDRKNTQWISTLLVFIITMITFGTFTSAIIPIAVVTLSVNWLYGTMGYNNLPISTLAGGVAAMVIGIGIDFAIHIMNKFKYERKKGIDIKKAIELAVVETGTALTATSFTTIAAFLAFLIGQMPEMGRFGILMAIGITYSLIFSVLGLPALLIIEEKIIYWLRTKVRFGVEGEFTLKRDEDKKSKFFNPFKINKTKRRRRK